MENMYKFILSKERLSNKNQLLLYQSIIDSDIAAIKCTWKNIEPNIYKFETYNYYNIIILYDANYLKYTFNNNCYLLVKNRIHIFNCLTTYEIDIDMKDKIYTLVQILIPVSVVNKAIFDVFKIELPELFKSKYAQDNILMILDIYEPVIVDVLNKIEKTITFKDSPRKLKIKSLSLLIILTAMAKFIAQNDDKRLKSDYLLGSWHAERFYSRYLIVDKITEYIDKHVDDNLNLQKLASIAAVSPSHLCVLFKRTIGMTLGEYINETRMEIGCTLLNKINNVTEVATRVGFNDISYFTTKFKKLYGITPTRYIKENNN